METDTSRAIDAVRAGLREVESCLFVQGDACTMRASTHAGQGLGWDCVALQGELERSTPILVRQQR